MTQMYAPATTESRTQASVTMNRHLRISLTVCTTLLLAARASLLGGGTSQNV